MTTHHPDDAAVSRRRALLVAGAAGLGGAAALATAAPAHAKDGNPLTLGQPNDSTATTTLTVAAGPGDPGADPDGIPGLHLATDSGRTALRVHSTHGNAILATSAHTDHSVAPVSAYGSHVGVYGQVNADNAPALWGQGGGNGGKGVYGWGTGPHSIGVHGASIDGVGGVFEGTDANLTLTPVADAATHPTAGHTGSLFVDQTGRLWYCRTGGDPATWVQLA